MNVRRANTEMRVSLRLVDLRDSDHPWIKTYQRPMKDVFALESKIARAVAAVTSGVLFEMMEDYDEAKRYYG